MCVVPCFEVLCFASAFLYLPASPLSCPKSCHHPRPQPIAQKGISLPADQWSKLMGGMDELQAAVEEA